MTFTCGIDYHGKNLVAVVIDEHSNQIASTKIEGATVKSLATKLDHWLRENSLYVVDLVVESSGTVMRFVRAMLQMGYPVHVAQPDSAGQINRGHHTDDYDDARTLARLHKGKLLQDVHILTEWQEKVRSLVRQALKHHYEHIKTQQRLQQILGPVFAIRLTTEDLLKMHGKDIADVLGHGSADFRIAVELLENNRYYYQSADALFTGARTPLSSSRAFRLLQTVPGINWKFACVIVAETQPVGRFRNAKAYAAYCGLAPRRAMSNGRVKWYDPAKGNPRLKDVYFQMAKKVLESIDMRKMFGFPVRPWKVDLKTRIRLASKLCKICYNIMRDEMPFSPEKAAPSNQTEA